MVLEIYLDTQRRNIKPSRVDCRGFYTEALFDTTAAIVYRYAFHSTSNSCLFSPSLFVFRLFVFSHSIFVDIATIIHSTLSWFSQHLKWSDIFYRKNILLLRFESRNFRGWLGWVERRRRGSGKISVRMSNEKRKTIKKSWAFFRFYELEISFPPKINRWWVCFSSVHVWLGVLTAQERKKSRRREARKFLPPQRICV